MHLVFVFLVDKNGMSLVFVSNVKILSRILLFLVNTTVYHLLLELGLPVCCHLLLLHNYKHAFIIQCRVRNNSLLALMRRVCPHICQ